MALKHIGPIYQEGNGVAKYSSHIDQIIDTLPQTNDSIEHFELGYTGHRELWLALRAIKRSKMVLTLHDPPAVTGKPFGEFLPGNAFLTKMLRKALDITIGQIIIRRVVRHADAIIVLNRLATSKVEKKFGLDSARVYTLPLISLLPAPPAAQTEVFTVLTLGNISPRKGIDLLIRAFGEVFERHNKAKLVVVGGFSNEERYMKKLQDMSVGLAVEFKGFLSDADLAIEIGRSSIVVLPYYNPGIIHASGPLIAAMAAGKPVIASCIPIFEGEIEDGKTGLLFEEGSVEDLKDKLLKIATRPNLAKEIGQAAAKHIRSDHNLDIIKTKLIKIYESV